MTDIPRSPLPELPDARYFSSPVFSWIAATFWSNEHITSIPEAIEVVADNLTPDELAIAAGFMQDYNELRLECGQRINPYIKQMVAQHVNLQPVEILDKARNALKTDFCTVIARDFLKHELEDVAAQVEERPTNQPGYPTLVHMEIVRRNAIQKLTEQNKDQQTLAITLHPPSGLCVLT